MMNKIRKLLSDFDNALTALYRPVTKLAIGIILVIIFLVSCVQIIDRRTFYGLVKKAALEDVRQGYIYSKTDSTVFVNGLITAEEETISLDSKHKEVCLNKEGCKPVKGNGDSRDVQMLEILSKSDRLLGANDLTYYVTLIVALLASLLLYRIETMNILVEENKVLKEETKSYYAHTVKFDNLLTRIESAYNITILIGNMATALIQTNRGDDSIMNSTNIGHLCTRLSLLCSEIDDRLNTRVSRVDFLTADEKGILDMYLEDAIDEMKRSLSCAKRIDIADLCYIIEKNERSIEDIKEAISAIAKKNESVI